MRSKQLQIKLAGYRWYRGSLQPIDEATVGEQAAYRVPEAISHSGCEASFCTDQAIRDAAMRCPRYPAPPLPSPNANRPKAMHLEAAQALASARARIQYRYIGREKGPLTLLLERCIFAGLVASFSSLALLLPGLLLSSAGEV